MISETENKEQIRKQWLALNPHSTPEHFERAYPGLKILYAESGNLPSNQDVFVRNRVERSMADVILERQKERK